jgi:hypothetical protein
MKIEFPTVLCKLTKVLTFSGDIQVEEFVNVRQKSGSSLNKILIVFRSNVCAKVCAGQNGRLGVARKLLKIWCPLVDSNY